MTRANQYSGKSSVPLQYLGCFLSLATRFGVLRRTLLLCSGVGGSSFQLWVLLSFPLPCVFLETGPSGHSAGVWEARASLGRPHREVLLLVPDQWLSADANLSLFPFT